MIDIHSHVVYDYDDGPSSLGESLALLQEMAAQGIRKVCAASHFKGPYGDPSYHERFRSLQTALNNTDLEMELIKSHEILLKDNTVDNVKARKALTYEKTNYVLVEFPVIGMYPVHEQWIQDLQDANYHVILAHVDRYDCFHKSPGRLDALINRNVLLQMNASFILNNKTRKTALQWIERGLVHFIASDTHGLKKRRPQLYETRRIIDRYFKPAVSKQLLVDNPERMLADNPPFEIINRNHFKSLKRNSLNQIIRHMQHLIK